MTGEIAWVFTVLIATVVLFVADRFRLDVVALLALLALSVSGVLTPPEALAGFADPVVIMIAALFVVGDGLFQTGVAGMIGRIPGRFAGNSETRLLVIVMLLVAGLSALMSSTGTVAVMLPVVLGLAWARDISPSKLLIPLSVASLLGGMLTLIGTAPNLVVSNHLVAMGREPFGFFSFTPVGAVMVVVGVVFMATVGRRLLPDRVGPPRPPGADGAPAMRELAEEYDIERGLFRIRPPADASWTGRTLAELDLSGTYGLTVLQIVEPEGHRESGAGAAVGAVVGRRSSGRMAERPARADTVVRPGSVLVVHGPADGMAHFVARTGCAVLEEGEDAALTGGDSGIAEILLTPKSRLIGKSLADVQFRDRYHLTVVGLKRLGKAVSGDVRALPLRFGDTLLVQGGWDRIRLLQQEPRDFVVPLAPREMIEASRPLGRAPVALGIMLAMMLVMTLGLLPPVFAVLLSAVAMVLTGCVGGADAYRAVNWESVVLIAAILPVATALEKTGGLDLIVAGLEGALSGSGPIVLLAVLFVVTSLLSQVISNTATAVLLAPIAYELAVSLGAAPEPFMMGIAVAASTAFATPVASPVNTLVLGPGGYRFGDFFKVGVSLQFLILVVSLLLIPWLFPFAPGG
jgi:di/tricarboxylate transporter